MTALRNLNLMYHVAGFIDANKFTPFELIEAGIMNYNKPLNNYSDYLKDATYIYNDARGLNGFFLDAVYTESARGLLMAMKYKPFNALRLVLFVQSRWDAQISYPKKSNFDSNKYRAFIGLR